MGEIESQIALCATNDVEIKNITERVLLKAKISYLMKCERQVEKNSNNKIVFYIEKQEADRAIEVIKDLKHVESDLELLYSSEQ